MDHDNSHENHGSSTKTTTTTPSRSSSSTPSKQHIYKKLMYIGILLFTIFIICLSTTTTTTTNGTSILIQVLFQYHEPSIRIFRSLIEIVLLFICTAISIRVYIYYISFNIIQQLLFQSIDCQSDTIDDDEDDDADDDGKEYIERKYDHELFQPVNDNDIDNLNKDDENDLMQNQNSHTTESWHIVDQLKVETTTTTSLHQLSLTILSMACDLFIYTCMTLILYLLSAIHTLQQQQQSVVSISTTETHNHNDQQSMMVWIAKVAAPTFPLLLFIFCIIQCIQYYSRYKEFYTILSYTMYAPFYNVTFRDGMIGDILTSMVRPMQDIAFTVCYMLFGLRGYWSDHQHDYYSYMQHAAASTTTNDVSTSLNNLPHLLSSSSNNITTSFGNAWVQSADAYVPSMERSWIVHTAILPACMISPLWWRFLQTIRQSYEYEQRWPYLGNSMKYFFAAQVAMLGVYHPSLRQSTVWICSFVLATLYQIYWDVFMDWGLLVRNHKTNTWNLRTQRLYPWKSFYWILLVVNTVLRFCWTLSFVPFNYLSATGVLTNNFSNEAWANVLVPTIATAEIIRRTLWGLIRVEWEAIKVKNEMSNDSDDSDHDVEMTPMKVFDTTESWRLGTNEFSSRYKVPFTSDMSSMNKIQIFGELCLYTTTFAVLGLIIAAHRGTM